MFNVIFGLMFDVWQFHLLKNTISNMVSNVAYGIFIFILKCVYAQTQFRKQEIQGFHLTIHLFHVCEKLYVDNREKITLIIKVNHMPRQNSVTPHVIFAVEKYTYSYEKLSEKKIKNRVFLRVPNQESVINTWRTFKCIKLLLFRFTYISHFSTGNVYDNMFLPLGEFYT